MRWIIAAEVAKVTFDIPLSSPFNMPRLHLSELYAIRRNLYGILDFLTRTPLHFPFQGLWLFELLDSWRSRKIYYWPM